MARKIQPTGDRVLVKASETGEVIKGGIILPETAKEKPQEGKVMAAGLGRRTDDGKLIPLDVKLGDTVIYSKYGGTEIKEDGQELLLLRESDILAKIA